jgi:uncharacterized BrkB/YihY/UPF0761 family membrane protein
VKQQANDLMFDNGIFIRIVLATAAILLIPLLAMQFTSEVRWDTADFIVMGSLAFGMASLFVLAARRVPRNRRILVGGLFTAAFLYIWAELAVGLFTNLGS